MEWSRVLASIFPGYRAGGWLPALVSGAVGEALRNVPGVDSMFAGIFWAVGQGFLALAAGLFLIWFVYVIRSLTPAGRFRYLRTLIAKSMRSFYANGYLREDMTVHESIATMVLVRKLERWNIPRPPLESDAETWTRYLTRLYAMAELGDRSGARKIWQEMSEEQPSEGEG